MKLRVGKAPLNHDVIIAQPTNRREKGMPSGGKSKIEKIMSNRQLKIKTSLDRRGIPAHCNIGNFVNVSVRNSVVVDSVQ